MSPSRGGVRGGIVVMGIDELERFADLQQHDLPTLHSMFRLPDSPSAHGFCPRSGPLVRQRMISVPQI